MKKQVVIIHGGDSFDSYRKFLDALKSWKVSLKTFLPKYDWKSNLQKELGEKFEVLSPRMPNKQNAKYTEWKIWFERMLPLIRNEVVLIGHSLGGLFLAKYFSENLFPKKIGALFLVAAPHSKTKDIGTFKLKRSLKKISEQSKAIHIFQSQDDPIVAPGEAGRYKGHCPRPNCGCSEIAVISIKRRFPSW